MDPAKTRMWNYLVSARIPNDELKNLDLTIAEVSLVQGQKILLEEEGSNGTANGNLHNYNVFTTPPRLSSLDRQPSNGTSDIPSGAAGTFKNYRSDALSSSYSSSSDSYGSKAKPAGTTGTLVLDKFIIRQVL